MSAPGGPPAGCSPESTTRILKRGRRTKRSLALSARPSRGTPSRFTGCPSNRRHRCAAGIRKRLPRPRLAQTRREGRLRATDAASTWSSPPPWRKKHLYGGTQRLRHLYGGTQRLPSRHPRRTHPGGMRRGRGRAGQHGRKATPHRSSRCRLPPPRSHTLAKGGPLLPRAAHSPHGTCTWTWMPESGSPQRSDATR